MTAKRITELRVWLTAALFVFALLAVVGFFIVMGMFTGEYWCADRHPWWGPPESGTDPDCGFGYEEWHRRSP